ncbi:hypothetical protein KEM55_007048 [Ascosphaera atra]|nr:hypothetical protein KEM55_007048 [Ascosphaera atra]
MVSEAESGSESDNSAQEEKPATEHRDGSGKAGSGESQGGEAFHPDELASAQQLRRQEIASAATAQLCPTLPIHEGAASEDAIAPMKGSIAEGTPPPDHQGSKWVGQESSARPGTLLEAFLKKAPQCMQKEFEPVSPHSQTAPRDDSVTVAAPVSTRRARSASAPPIPRSTPSKPKAVLAATQSTMPLPSSPANAPAPETSQAGVGGRNPTRVPADGSPLPQYESSLAGPEPHTPFQARRGIRVANSGALMEYIWSEDGLEEVKQMPGYNEVVQSITLSRLILAPIHYVEHSTLAVFLPESKQYPYLDSLYKLDRSSQDNGLNIVPLLLSWWVSVGITDDVHLTRLNVRSPEQENRCNCGVFVCSSARLLALSYNMSSTDPLPYFQGDIPSYRHHKCWELLAGATCGRGIPGNDFWLMCRYIACSITAQELLRGSGSLRFKTFMKYLVSDEAPRVVSAGRVDGPGDEEGKATEEKAEKGKKAGKGKKAEKGFKAPKARGGRKGVMKA